MTYIPAEIFSTAAKTFSFGAIISIELTTFKPSTIFSVTFSRISTASTKVLRCTSLTSLPSSTRLNGIVFYTFSSVSFVIAEPSASSVNLSVSDTDGNTASQCSRNNIVSMHKRSPLILNLQKLTFSVLAMVKTASTAFNIEARR